MLQFEKNAAKYEKIRNKITYPTELYTYLASLCQATNSALDIGCGNGVSTIRLQPYFTKIKGIDLGHDLINFARQSYPELEFAVMKAEEIPINQTYDLITSATSFYWMDRPLIIDKLSSLLNPQGVFCAYKYDFPIPYGTLRDFIYYELATKWSKYRDQRLVDYDDTLELLNNSNIFSKTGRFIISNIIELTTEEIAYFFLSTSYVTAYIEQSGDVNYPKWFLNECSNLNGNDNYLKVNFDIHAFYAIKG